MNLKNYIWYFLAFSLGFLSCFLGIYNFQKKDSIPYSLQVISTEGIQTEKKIQENTEQYKIRVYYPYTSYQLLDNKVSSFIQKQIQEFKDNIQQNSIPKLQFYTLDIRYDCYTYQNFISYVFYIFVDTGGAHPNTTIHTITFDKDTNKLVDIHSLMKENSELLETLSRESLLQLKDNEKFQQDDLKNIQDMIIEGTKAIPENFRNFAFSEKGLILFFENYQVAPYVYGGFQVMIPYSVLKLGI